MGGYFLSTPGFNSAARWLTLFLGGIPFFVPLAFGVFTISTLIERLNKRRAGPSALRRGRAKLAPFIAPALAAGLLGVMGWLLEAGVSGWAVGYCSAKLAERELPGLPAADREQGARRGSRRSRLREGRYFFVTTRFAKWAMVEPSIHSATDRWRPRPT